MPSFLLPAVALLTLAAAGAPRADTDSPIATALQRVAPEASNAQLEGYLPLLQRAYAARDYQPLWTDAAGPTARGRQVLRALHTADEHGLSPEDYLVPVLDSIFAGRPRDRLADGEVLLSLAMLRLAHDLGWGVVDPGKVGRDNHYVLTPFQPDSVLARAVAASDPGAYLLGLAPSRPAYASLMAALAQLRAIEARGTWRTVAAGPPLKRGAKGPRVRELRAQLAVRGDLAADRAAGDSFDLELAAAVARFQDRHGLKPDSVYGPGVVSEVNVPVTTRIQQVRLGLERLRWLPHDPTGRWIRVNLADFRAEVVDDGKVTFQTRAVIGKQFHETPAFVDTMTYVVINPYWNVPPSIARGEILPKVRRDPGYLGRNHMEMVGGSGVRQLPGPWNALGRFKFMLPNPYNIYLHDTPAKALFNEASRAYSHGCVRIHQPADLAAVLLGGQGWTPERIAETVASGQRTAITLETPIPVYITYVTAFLGADGTLQYRRDVYGRDRKLAEALAHHAAGSWES